MAQGFPEGDAFIVETPTLDRLGQQLMAQHQARRDYQAKISTNIDESLNKELGNVRSVDMSEVSDAYNKWKAIQQKNLFDQRIQNNPTLYNQGQQDAAAAYADVAAKIRKSTELANQAKELVAERKTKPNLYSDDFGDRMTAFLNTPMGQLQNHPKYGDLSNFDNYRYKGSQTDFSKLDAAAAGQLKPSFNKEERISDLQTKVTPYQFGRSPSEYFEALKGAYLPHQAFRDASAAWEAIPQAQRDEVDRQFAQIPPEKWQLMGVDKPQVIAPNDPTNPAENLAAYKAKLYAINAQPRPAKESSIINKAAQMALQQREKIDFEGIRQGNRIALAKFKQDYGDKSDEDKRAAIDEFMQGYENKGKERGALPYKAANGQTFNTYSVPLAQDIKDKLFTKTVSGHREPPDDVRVNDAGDYIGIWYKKEDGQPVKGTSGYAVSESIPPVIVSRDEVKAELVNKYLPKKAAAGRMGGQKPKAPADAAKKAEDLLKKYGVQ